MADRSKYIWYNSEILPWDNAKIHVMSHVIHYGSGVWEGIKCYNTNFGPAIFRLEDHVRRLYDSAKLYSIDIKLSKSSIIKGCIDIVKMNNLSSCYIRPIIFYGFDTLGVHPKNCPINVAIGAFNWGAYLGEKSIKSGANVTISTIMKFSNKSMPTIAKASGHYTNSYLSVLDAKNRGFDEAILLNESGEIAEGSGQNIFFVKDSTLYTNDEYSSILLGITRDTVIKIARDNGLKVIVKSFSSEELCNSDEVFFSGTASEITPIRSIDHKLISNGEIGEITRLLRSEYISAVTGVEKKYHNWLSFINSDYI